MHCFEEARRHEMQRVADKVLTLRFETIDGQTMSDDKARFVSDECGVAMDAHSVFVLRRIRLRLKNDINRWLCEVVFKERRSHKKEDSVESEM